MTMFTTLFFNMLPLYGLIGLGYAAGRFFKADQTTLANIVIFFFIPIVAFGSVAQAEFRADYFLVPFIMLAYMFVLGFLTLFLGQKIYADKRSNLLALVGASNNVGYFGVPLVMLIYNDQWLAIYIMVISITIIYEATFSYYIAARGQFGIKDSLKKLVRYPVLYGVAAGLVVNALQIELPEVFFPYYTHFKGAYVILGMMIIGAALANMPKFAFCPRFVSLVFGVKYLLAPLMTFSLVLIDRAFFNIFEPEIHGFFLLIGLMPPAANTVAFAAQFDFYPERAATTVVFATIFALFYIPAICAISGLF